MCHVCKVFHKKEVWKFRAHRMLSLLQQVVVEDMFFDHTVVWECAISSSLASQLVCVSEPHFPTWRRGVRGSSVMIRCRRVESRLSTFQQQQQRENRAISQTTSSRLLLGSQKSLLLVLFPKILRIFPISPSRNGNDAATQRELREGLSPKVLSNLRLEFQYSRLEIAFFAHQP